MRSCPISSCSSRASRASLELLCLDDAAKRVARVRSERSTAIGRSRCERLCEPQVVLGEARASLQLVQRVQDADRPVSDRRAGRTARSFARSRRAACWSTSGSSSIESTRSLRRRSNTRPSLDVAMSTVMPSTSSSPAPLALSTRSRAGPSGREISTSRACTSSRSRAAISSRSAGDRPPRPARFRSRSATRAGATSGSSDS